MLICNAMPQVFLSQLALRASLVNAAFQRAVTAVVRAHAADLANLDMVAMIQSGSSREAPCATRPNTSAGGRWPMLQSLHSLGNGRKGVVPTGCPATSLNSTDSGPSAFDTCTSGFPQAQLLMCSFEEGADLVEVLGGPIKEMSRMREKLVEYVPPHPRGAWPLAANVLDPVRASIITRGPSRIRQVVRWFAEAGAAGANAAADKGGSKEEEAEAVGWLQVCRIKNGFALPRAEVLDGYRDVKLFLLFTDLNGLRILGEVQV